MPLIHDRRECLTGCQDHAPWSPRTDLRVDFVMVYGIDASMPDRVREYRDHGYVVHLMTGCVWGDYQDYLDGAWDGADHWDECQRTRDGQPVMHGLRTPYLCPSPTFSRYLLRKLKPAVDAGVEAVHLEEPEFWDAAGYGAAFRRAWAEYYGEPWQPPHASLENRWKASALKVVLLRRLIAEVGAGLKEYARSLGRSLAVYVPTHSLVNYTQWKILSPEGTLLDIPSVDGCVAQVWTGTARAGHVYRGRYDERTFETAFLEYGIMQELVRGTGRKMWFLHDPVEDNPEYTWENFRENYLKTVAASLMHPAVFRFEVMPWPDRVFNGVYPKKGRVDAGGLRPGDVMEGAKPIPPAYAELLCTLVQTLGDMAQPDSGFVPSCPRIGLLMADSALYQRSFPDGVPSAGGPDALNDLLVSLKVRRRAGEDVRQDSAALMRRIADNPPLFNDYAASGAFPHFYGLAMPLVKAGVPLRPLLFENIPRDPSCLDFFSALILSDEWMKPRDPEALGLLASWVRRGGTLLLAGDGSDPYLAVARPVRDLCVLLGLPPDPEEGVYAAGAGRLAVRRISPARITLTAEAADAWLRWVLDAAAPDFVPRNYFLMRRGPYRIAAVMEESVSAGPLVLEGCFADLLSGGFGIVRRKAVPPGGTALLFDLADPSLPACFPVASTARIDAMEESPSGWVLRCRIPEGVRIRMLLRLPAPAASALARTEDGAVLPPETCRWDGETRTLLLSFPAGPRSAEISLFSHSPAGGESDA